MKLRMTIPVLLAVLLWGCDSSSTSLDGTSSETATGLQLLADNASVITTSFPAKGVAAGRLARGLETAPDTAKARIDSIYRAVDCDGVAQSYYVGLGGVQKLTNRPGVGVDGQVSSCSGDYSRHWFREQRNDSLGWDDYEGTSIDSGVEYVWNPDWGWDGFRMRSEFTGKGIWRLRSGLTLQYDSMSMSYRYVSGRPTSLRFVQKIRFAETCRVELDFDLNAPIDAPVSCDGAVVGRFTWDNRSTPVVLDLQGRRVVPRGTGVGRYAEDSLGLSLSQARVDTTGGAATLRASLSWRLLPGDTIAAGDTVRAQIATTGWSGFAVLGENGAFALPLGAVTAGDTLRLSVVKPGFEARLAVRLPVAGTVQVGSAARGFALSPVVRSGLLRSLR